MTAQSHIDAIGQSIIKTEQAIDDAIAKLKKAKENIQILHRRADKAQAAYLERYGSESNVVAFSGGTDKPPVDEPDEPLDPIP